MHIKSILKDICNSEQKLFSTISNNYMYPVQIKLRNTKCSVKTLAGYTQGTSMICSSFYKYLIETDWHIFINSTFIITQPHFNIIT